MSWWSSTPLRRSLKTIFLRFDWSRWTVILDWNCMRYIIYSKVLEKYLIFVAKTGNTVNSWIILHTSVLIRSFYNILVLLLTSLCLLGVPMAQDQACSESQAWVHHCRLQPRHAWGAGLIGNNRKGSDLVMYHRFRRCPTWTRSSSQRWNRGFLSSWSLTGEASFVKLWLNTPQWDLFPPHHSLFFPVGSLLPCNGCVSCWPNPSATTRGWTSSWGGWRRWDNLLSQTFYLQYLSRV